MIFPQNWRRANATGKLYGGDWDAAFANAIFEPVIIVARRARLMRANIIELCELNKLLNTA